MQIGPSILTFTTMQHGFSVDLACKKSKKRDETIPGVI